MKKHQIVRISILPFNMVNAFLIIGTQGCVLVDTGLPGSENKIAGVLSKNGLSFKDIKLIVVTHAHVDHAGNASLLRHLTGAPILGHAGDLKYFNRELPMGFCPTGWAGRIFLKTPLPHQSYLAFTPDIVLSSGDEMSLTAFGINGVIKHTPGHTDGSISIELFNGDALVGDLIASGIMIGGILRLGHAIRPPFEDNPYAVGQALQRLLDSGMENFYMGHGGPLSAQTVYRHAQKLMLMNQGI